MNKVLLILLFYFAFPFLTEAANWKVTYQALNENESAGFEIYLDTESISFPQKDIARFWRKIIVFTPTLKRESILLEEINCKENKIITIQQSNDGIIEKEKAEWVYIDPSNHEMLELIKFLCKSNKEIPKNDIFDKID